MTKILEILCSAFKRKDNFCNSIEESIEQRTCSREDWKKEHRQIRGVKVLKAKMQRR